MTLFKDKRLLQTVFFDENIGGITVVKPILSRIKHQKQEKKEDCIALLLCPRSDRDKKTNFVFFTTFY